MRAVVQRVASARVRVDAPRHGIGASRATSRDGKLVGEIGRGLLLFAGVEKDDEAKDVQYIVEKVRGLRVFEDAAHKMNLSITDVGGSILVVSQFTLAGDCRRGRRPSFDAAESPAVARPVFDSLVAALRATNLTVETGEFQADMQVELINDGPVTLLLDSRRRW
jgi:D-aminoacyl-tRNA deacylase